MSDGTPPDGSETLLDAIANLSQYHREHEKFYASAPRAQAVALQRHSRALLALADRWSSVDPVHPRPFSPYEGTPDLNADAAIQLDGILFMEGGDEPVEITRLVRDLRAAADDASATGAWLSDAMAASWSVAEALLDVPALAPVLGERHRIIANDWLAAAMSEIAGRCLARAADVLECIDFRPPSVRADLEGARRTVPRLYSAAELVGHAADLLSDSAGLDHDNERRWRTFRTAVREAGG